MARKFRRWLWRGIALPLLLVAIVAAVYFVAPYVQDSSVPDTDGDGLVDAVEKTGWVTRDGMEYRTDPDLADTDGDGLSDGDEAGAASQTSDGDLEYYGHSDPLMADTDDDGLGDAGELDLDLNAFDDDSDDDDLSDGSEVEVLGSDPTLADTDGDGFDDGFEDAHRESQGLDPLVVDVEVSKTSFISDFAKGAVLGDLNREDSLAWLSGNIASSGSSLVPGVGWLVGAAADIRDVVGSAIRADWVGSGFSAAGVVPEVGDAIAIPGKVAKFVSRNPELAAAVGAALVGFSKVPEKIKIETSKKLWKDWDDLKAAGSSDKALLQLQKGQTNLDEVATAMKRPTHVAAPPAKFFKNGPEGEKYLAQSLGDDGADIVTQKLVSTTGCSHGCNNVGRVFDVVKDGVAHESKVGRTSLGIVEKQIRSDHWLIKNGDITGAHWHFYPSSASNTVGAPKSVYDLLDEYGIPYTIHLP